MWQRVTKLYKITTYIEKKIRISNDIQKDLVVSSWYLSPYVINKRAVVTCVTILRAQDSFFRLFYFTPSYYIFLIGNSN